jgi:hypothetical protein
MSVREFARHLGVSDRMVSKWEAGDGSVHPRPVNQSALDTSLATASPEAKARFTFVMSAGGASRRVSRDKLVDPAMSIALSVLRHPDDGKLMALVPAGVSPLGEESKPVWLDGFFIDVYPVTNADYERFIAATGHPSPLHWTERDVSATSDHPVVGVTWHDATTYALWAGKQLPTGPQWEKAARGPAGHLYPWGDVPSHRHSNVRESRIKTTTPVTWYSNGVSAFGVYDLCGNVQEWCATEWSTATPQIRGGGFNSPGARAKPTSARPRPASAESEDVGFRCVTRLAEALEILADRIGGST